ncbi:glycosyltransferase family 2 protein [Nonomuraea endophytica]|uniref:Glycosyltransferase involved in cell wall biosynthesis n=1 Tax=Nonomuraea endophytica TaxID=714136 RepID=A0A7W8A3B0_9ACTN|nr:glycosyltransferase [Nonomuraea endophytica]MBB5078752.1 glycosyltransferase involved in cell wall biosynthesis [Nonomuraea endophytica]
MLFSIVIPYKQRLRNIRAVFTSLAEQTLAADRFEVVVGALEYCEEYVAACREFAGRLNIVSVLSDAAWNVSHARNLAMRQASGQVTVILDADMALPAGLLERLYLDHFARGQNVCVLGQAVGYSGKESVEEVTALPYSHYREVLARIEREGAEPDVRWGVRPLPLPWALVWSGLVALPTATVRGHDLAFDEGFQGWGAEDQEWGWRIHASGTPIVLGDRVYGLHLPHRRDAPANFACFRANRRYFLAKWPCLEVEVYRAYDFAEANRRFDDIRREVVEMGVDLCCLRGSVGGRDVLLVGATAADGAVFDGGVPSDTLPLVGFALPYPDGDVGECRVMAPILRLGAASRETVLKEAERVAARVVAPVGS